jgi:CRP-like cAMP-binding protein
VRRVREAMNKSDLGKSPVFAELPPEEMELIAALGESVSVPDGQALFREGDPASHLYLVLAGRLALRMSLPNQKTLSVATIEPGEELGWSALRRGKPYTATAVAIGAVEAIRIPSDRLLRLFESNPRMAYVVCRGVIGIVAERLSEARLRIANMEQG